MTTPPQAKNPSNLIDKDGINTAALKHAWAQFAIYDETAKDLKRRYITARQRVIHLTLLGTVAAIGSGVANFSNTEMLVFVLGFIAVAAPSIGSFILRDAVQFVGQTEWVHNRYIAERLRQQIYHYRTKSGDFAKLDPNDTDDVLSEKIKTIRDEMRAKITLPPAMSLSEIQAKIEADLKADKEATDGTKSKIGKSVLALKFDDYVKERVVEQINWYDHKVKDAFQRRKNYFRASQFALLVGALIGAVTGVVNSDVIVIIAITNAISESIMSWADVSLSGATYSIFSLTSSKLSDMHLQNIANQTGSSSEDDTEQLNASFVDGVEKILEWERNEWYEHLLRTQADVDDRISKQLDAFLADDQNSSDAVG